MNRGYSIKDATFVEKSSIDKDAIMIVNRSSTVNQYIQLNEYDHQHAHDVISTMMSTEDHKEKIRFAYAKQAKFQIEKIAVSMPDNITFHLYNLWAIFSTEDDKAEYILTHE